MLAPIPITSRHKWTCRTCGLTIPRGDPIVFAPGGLFRPYHTGECWEKRPRRFRSRHAIMLELLGLDRGRRC